MAEKRKDHTAPVRTGTHPAAQAARAKRPGPAAVPAVPDAAESVPAAGSASCKHEGHHVVTYFARGHWEEIDTSVNWCPRCGALGSVRYVDGESIRWKVPTG